MDNYISAKSVYDWKGDEYGWPTKTKARVVVLGDQQRVNIDVGELFTPTFAVSSVRLLTAMACELDLDLCNIVIEQAFVQSDLEENVYIRLPRGCGRLSGKVIRQKKSLYGLKQASRKYHAHLTRCLLPLGIVQCLADACVFRLMEGGSIVITIVVHVNDIFAVEEKARCDEFGRNLNRTVPVKNLGELRWYSGSFYERDWEKGTRNISRKTLVEPLAEKYRVEYGMSVPPFIGTKLADFDTNIASGNGPFRELIGSLMWLLTQTRPDISNAARAVARYCAAPKYVH